MGGGSDLSEVDAMITPANADVCTPVRRPRSSACCIERVPADLIARQGVAVTADLRAAAFGTAADRQASPRDRWLAAVTLGGQGRYAAAAATLRDLHTGSDPLYAALAGATMASHLRQLGGHEHARRLDAAALRRLPSGRLPSRSEPDPDGVDHAGALVDALLGLAADAIGLGRVTEAARLHAAATAAAGDERVWRVTVRIDWVATEVALAAGRFGDAVPPAERAMAAARAAGAVRHTVKSTMMLGAAL